MKDGLVPARGNTETLSVSLALPLDQLAMSLYTVLLIKVTLNFMRGVGTAGYSHA